jgi:GH15 family glucan-1,4-alpha-glucosidase
MHDDPPAISDYGLIGDRRSAALVSRDGSIDWCCMPRLDRGSCLGRLLDPDAGHCTLAPASDDFETERAYTAGTMVLETEFTAASGKATLTDCFLLPEDDEPSALVRVFQVTEGELDVLLDLRLRFDYGEVDPWIRLHAPQLHSATGGDDGIVIWCSAELELRGRHDLAATASLKKGERLSLSLRACTPEQIDLSPLGSTSEEEIDAAIERTRRSWSSWSGKINHEGDDVEAVCRSALVLQSLSNERTGAIAAAATTSLPEGLGAEGGRNWDYRYSWVRDSALAVRSMARVGFEENAYCFRRFIERSAAGNAADLQVLFGIGGERRLSELELDHLDGYRGASPVRVGNGAADQLQLDAFGLILEQVWRGHDRGHEVDDDLWRFLTDLVDAAVDRWREPDAGFWEAREPRRFTHSRVLCWTAADRGLRIAEAEGREAPRDRWAAARDEIRGAVESEGFDHDRGVFVRDFDSTNLDASALRFPTVGFCDWDDERMLRTADAIEQRLDFGGLLRRYDADDGFDVEEGAFIACGFWLAECLARQGRAERARAVFERSLATRNDLGLYSEEFDPDRGEMLGNFPQALSHLSHLEASIALAEA